MKRIGILIQVHARKIAYAVAATIGAAAIAGYVFVWNDQADVAAPPAPVVTADPDPTAPHYGGGSGEDTHDDNADGDRIWTPGPTTTPDRDLVDTAERFAQAWARPGLTTDAWLDGVDQYATNDYVRSVGDIDPARVPATKVTGPAVVVESRTDEATVDVPTDGGTLRLHMVSLVGQWWVTLTDWEVAA